jgi:hypothetical protein
MYRMHVYNFCMKHALYINQYKHDSMKPCGCIHQISYSWDLYCWKLSAEMDHKIV